MTNTTINSFRVTFDDPFIRDVQQCIASLFDTQVWFSSSTCIRKLHGVPYSTVVLNTTDLEVLRNLASGMSYGDGWKVDSHNATHITIAPRQRYNMSGRYAIHVRWVPYYGIEDPWVPAQCVGRINDGRLICSEDFSEFIAHGGTVTMPHEYHTDAALRSHYGSIQESLRLAQIHALPAAGSRSRCTVSHMKGYSKWATPEELASPARVRYEVNIPPSSPTPPLGVNCIEYVPSSVWGNHYFNDTDRSVYVCTF